MASVLLDRMIKRVESAKDNSDSEYFDSLMLFGELLLKLTVIYASALITNGKDRNRYSVHYKLVRSTGIGDWSSTLEQITSGKQYLSIIEDAKQIVSEIMIKGKNDSWQYVSYSLLSEARSALISNSEKLSKASLVDFFKDFSNLRNKTKGHGAQLPAVKAQVCIDLQKSLDIIVENLNILKLQAAYLHKNLNGSYRISKISDCINCFDFLKSKGSLQKYPNGVYIHCNTLREVELFYTDPDLKDFLFPNGQSGSGFEILSYITGKTNIESLDKYRTPPEELPKSETFGLDGLEVIENVFSNMPQILPGYVRRAQLETEITSIVLDTRNPVITLSGRGGIGKTTILLSVLHEISKNDNLPFEIILWFSARDIDLKDSGPKHVQVAVLTKKDISEQYIKIMQPDESLRSSEEKIIYFTEALRNKYNNKGKLYIFDNFETLSMPDDIYSWLNTNIQLPNKVIITTRHRKFKGDYPIEITGMTDIESGTLINTHSIKLSISHLLTQSVMQEIIHLSDGHPYIIKVFLGQIAKDKNTKNVKRVIADRDDILFALFDRTFVQLSAAAQRVYLTICKWNSDIPEIALKAILMRSESSEIDVEFAIDELLNFSLIELNEVDSETSIINVPLASRIFGQNKIKSSAYQYIVNDDIDILHMLGASQKTETLEHVTSRLFSIINGIIDSRSIAINEKVNIAVYLGKKFPSILLRAALRLKKYFPDESRDLIEKFLSNDGISNYDKLNAWDALAFIYNLQGEGTKFIHAKTQYAKSCTDDFDMSCAANDINKYISENRAIIDTIEKRRILTSLAEHMEDHTKYWLADDYSRIAWLYMHAKNIEKAKTMAKCGISMEPDNAHCLNILGRISSEQ